MKISFKGAKLSDFMKSMLNDCIYYYAHTLLTNKEMEDLEILCKFTSKMQPKAKARVHHDIQDTPISKQSVFIVDLPKNFELTEAVKSLAHEMIHVKQALRNELVFVRKSPIHYTPHWKGVLVTETYYLCETNLPWEREAYRDSLELSESFLLFWNDKRLKG